MTKPKLTMVGAAAVVTLAVAAASTVLAQQSGSPAAPPAQGSIATQNPPRATPPAEWQPDQPLNEDRRAFEDYADAFDVFTDNSSQQREPSAGDDDRRDAGRDQGADADRRADRGRGANHDRGTDRDRGRGFEDSSRPRRRPMSRMAKFCGPHAAERANHKLDHLGRITSPTDAQRPAFDKLKQAAARAFDTIRASCPAEPAPVTPPGRLAAAEKRLDAMLQAVRIVRPALDEFYGALSDEQKARLYMAHERPQNFGQRLMRRFDRWRHGDDDRYGQQQQRSEGRRGRWRDDDRDDRRSGANRDDNEGRERRYDDRRYDQRDDWPSDWRGRS